MAAASDDTVFIHSQKSRSFDRKKIAQANFSCPGEIKNY